jgi:hypothetical protein
VTFYRPNMEMRCIRPGHWVVEGYHIEKTGRARWEVSTRHIGHPVTPHGAAPTLTDACGLVWRLTELPRLPPT